MTIPAPVSDGKQHACHHPIYMEKRNCHEDSLFPIFCSRHPAANLQCIGDQIAVECNCTFGYSRGATTVLEYRFIFRTDIKFWTFLWFVLGE